MNTLPFVTLAWTSEEALIAAGHDCQPLVFSGSPDGWALIGSLDAKSGAGGGSKLSSPVGRLNSAAFNTFRNAAERGQAGGAADATKAQGDTVLHTVHQNTITELRAYDGERGAVGSVSTSGVDGKLVVWDVGAVADGGLAGKLLSKLRI